MFDYQNSSDLISTIQTQKTTIANLNIENANLRQQIADYQTNLELNKDAIKDLISSMKQGEDTQTKTKGHGRRSSWWGTSAKPVETKDPHEKVHLVNTINKLVTENLNLQNEVFRIQEIFDKNLKESAELRIQSSLSFRSKRQIKTQSVQIQTDQVDCFPSNIGSDKVPQLNKWIEMLKNQVKVYLK